MPGQYSPTLLNTTDGDHDGIDTLSNDTEQPTSSSKRQKRPPMARKSSSMRNSDDYLTARFANPMTGLVSPSVFSSCSSGSITPRTPRTPGEALAQFYGEVSYATPAGKDSGYGSEGATEMLNTGKKSKRPLLRRTIGEDVLRSRVLTPSVSKFERKRGNASRSDQAIQCGAQDLSVPLETAGVTDIDRVASFWSKVRKRVQGPARDESTPSITVTDVGTDLSRLPPVHLIHPSRAATPRNETLQSTMPTATGRRSSSNCKHKKGSPWSLNLAIFARPETRTDVSAIGHDSKSRRISWKKFGQSIRYMILGFHILIIMLQAVVLVQDFITAVFGLALLVSRLIFIVSGIQ